MAKRAAKSRRAGSGVPDAAPPAANSPAAPPIGYDELLRRLADPDVDEALLDPYIVTRRDRRIGTAPVLLPSDLVVYDTAAAVQARARGNVALGMLNFAYRNRRLTIFNRRIAARDPRPVIMAEGDSWFQYPRWLKDTVDYLMDHYTVYCMSGAGDELRRIAEAVEFVDVWRSLAKREIEVRAILLSAGGNDVVGPEFRAILKDSVAGATPGACIDADAWGRKRADLERRFRLVFDKIRSLSPTVPVLVHGYDYGNPLPDQGFWNIPPKDGWLGDPMRSRQYSDVAFQRKIVAVLIDEVNTLIRAIANQYGHVHVVDNRNVVAGRWFDELHPDDDGFRDVAKNFRAKLQAIGV